MDFSAFNGTAEAVPYKTSRAHPHSESLFLSNVLSGRDEEPVQERHAL
jgi:hypothetical protein